MVIFHLSNSVTWQSHPLVLWGSWRVATSFSLQTAAAPCLGDHHRADRLGKPWLWLISCPTCYVSNTSSAQAPSSDDGSSISLILGSFSGSLLSRACPPVTGFLFFYNQLKQNFQRSLSSSSEVWHKKGFVVWLFDHTSPFPTPYIKTYFFFLCKWSIWAEGKEWRNKIHFGFL